MAPMRQEVKRYKGIKTADGQNGPTRNIQHMQGLAIQFAGTYGAGTVLQIFASIDGTNYVQVGANITAATVRTLEDHWMHFYIRTATHDGQVATAWYSGFQVEA